MKKRRKNSQNLRFLQFWYLKLYLKAFWIGVTCYLVIFCWKLHNPHCSILLVFSLYACVCALPHFFRLQRKKSHCRRYFYGILQIHSKRFITWLSVEICIVLVSSLRQEIAKSLLKPIKANSMTIHRKHQTTTTTANYLHSFIVSNAVSLLSHS